MSDSLPNDKEMVQIRVGLELHGSAIKAVIHAIESLLNNHPYHENSAKHDFKHAYTMILFSMSSWIAEQMRQVDKTTFENGKLCAIFELDEDDNPPPRARKKNND